MDHQPRMRVTATVIGAPDPRALADFYQRLLGWDRVEDSPVWVRLRAPGGGMGLSFQHEADYVPPIWPASPGSEQMTSHLDIAVEDLAAGVAWAEAAGAVAASFQPQPHVRVMLDPAGHPFCLFPRPFRGSIEVGTAREIVATNLYMTLATADSAGRPWATPVYFAPAGDREFLWVSKPGARHSSNIAARPEVGVVIFDSTTPISTGQGLYAEALAQEVPEPELDESVERFSASAVARGGRAFTRDDVVAPARHRLYKATASNMWLLDDHDERIPIDL